MKPLYTWLAALAFAGAALAAQGAHAQILQPPVRIVFPFAPGGGGDALARIMAEELKAGLNRNVVVENKTGGAGQVGVLGLQSAQGQHDAEGSQDVASAKAGAAFGAAPAPQRPSVPAELPAPELARLSLLGHRSRSLAGGCALWRIT